MSQEATPVAGHAGARGLAHLAGKHATFQHLLGIGEDLAAGGATSFALA